MTIKPDERKRIAGMLGIHEQYLYQILTGRKPAPAELCATIERETSGIYPRWRLRPNDWHRIWPELKHSRDIPPDVAGAAQAQTSEAGSAA